jgi:hypothetical protein
MLSSLRFRMILHQKQSGADNMLDSNDNLKGNIKTNRQGRPKRQTLNVWDTASYEYERDRTIVTAFALFLLIVLAASFDYCTSPSAPAVTTAAN